VVTKANIGGIVDHHNLIKMGAIMVMIVYGLRHPCLNEKNLWEFHEKQLFQQEFFNRSVAPVSPTNKTDHHEITEILLNVALNAMAHHIHLTSNNYNVYCFNDLGVSGENQETNKLYHIM
jgi:hypothetical protein